MYSLLMIGHSGNDVVQVIPWIYFMRLAGSQQRTDYRHASGCLVVAAEEVILSAQRDGADDIFCQVIVPQQASVFQTPHHVVPSGIGICDGFAGL